MAMSRPPGGAVRDSWYVVAMEHFLHVVEDLARARTMDEITRIVRRAARELTGADGATFVLRDGNQCFYVDENAIAPLWKGQRFPMSICISGWVMNHAQSVFIEDIYTDDRIPHDAYRPTFVKSMAMAPMGRDNPIGAIGNYWATSRKPAFEELKLLEALANMAGVAIENARLHEKLDRRA